VGSGLLPGFFRAADAGHESRQGYFVTNAWFKLLGYMEEIEVAPLADGPVMDIDNDHSQVVLLRDAAPCLIVSR
jgi:hypothetical protein